MSGAGTGYDLSPTTYNPEGRVFQIDYAVKATENGGTIVGMRCADGLVLGGERSVVSRMIVEGTNKIVLGVTKHIGAIITGVLPDGKAIISRARQEAAQYEQFYGKEICVKVLAERVALYMHAFTLYGVLRPFGSMVILAGIDQGQPRLFMVEPSGRFFEYYACSAGKGSQVCKGELDKLDLSNLSTEEGAYRLTKMLIKSREEGQDKRLDIEVGWLNGTTGLRFEPLPEDTRKRYEADATEELEKEEMGEA